MVAAAVVGSAVVGGVASNRASSRAAAAQSNAAQSAADSSLQASREANDLQRQQYEQNRQDLAPWRTAGAGAVGQLAAGIQPGGDFNRPFSMADYQADPGYDFRMSEGLRALRNSASARGMLRGGARLKDITRFGQDYASNEFGRAFDRYQTDLSGRYNREAGVAGTGQQATGQTAMLGAQYANQSGANTMGAAQYAGQAGMAGANARASGYVGGANAFTGALGQGANYLNQQSILSRIYPQGGGGGYGTIDPTQAGTGYPY